MVPKLYNFEKVYFDQLLNFPILLLLFLYFIILPYFILLMLICFNTTKVSNSLDPDQARYESKLFANVISSIKKSPLAGKELNTKQLVDATFWLKPWLNLISFGFNSFHLANAKVLVTINS